MNHLNNRDDKMNNLPLKKVLLIVALWTIASMVIQFQFMSNQQFAFKVANLTDPRIYLSGTPKDFINKYFTGISSLKQDQNSKLGFHGHIGFINFDIVKANLSSEVTWISALRDPIERFRSKFYFDRQPKSWKYSKEVLVQRGQEKAKRYLEMSLDQCIKRSQFF